MKSISRIVFGSLLSTVVGLAAICGSLSAQHKFPPKDGQEYLSPVDFSKLVDTLKELLADGELRQVIATANGLKSKMVVPKLDPRYRLRMKIESLVIQAKIAIEFASLRLRIDGIVMKNARFSAVLLNGEVFEVGEYIRRDLSLWSVGPKRIEFLYKGVVCTKTLVAPPR